MIRLKVCLVGGGIGWMKNKVKKIRGKKKELVLFDRKRRGGNFFARARHFSPEPTKNQSL